MTAMQLLDDYLAERHALGFVAKTDEGCIRRFLQDYIDPVDGNVEFSKEYVLQHIGNRLNQEPNTVQREASAVNGFMDFVIRKGCKAYKIPPRSLPKAPRNFKAYIFSDDEIERILDAAAHISPNKQNPLRHHQLPVMFRILFNCGLRSAELRGLRVRDVDLSRNLFVIWDTKFHKNRLVPFTPSVADSLKRYLQVLMPLTDDLLLFPSPKTYGRYARYSASWLQVQLQMLLRRAGIPYRGKGQGPRPHDTRHTFAVHCLNNWVLSGEDITVALPVLSRYLGHSSLKGTQKYLQLTAQMYPDITARLEEQFGDLIPQMGVFHEDC